MDYNWLENVPSSVTPIPVYQPDFSFLQSMQMKANAQYEQGFSEVKNTYASIFNKPVTGEAMNKRQQEYAKQAQQQMKAISAADLSDPKNVEAAENIMTPFYKDPLLVKNISYTSHYQDQFQKQQGMKNSTDPATRALYNPLVDSYLNNGLERLANAPLTTDAYNTIEKRESIPVFDLDSDVKKEWTDMFGKDGGIKTVNQDGMLMTITTNGPKSVAAYKSFYLSVAKRDKYAAQNRVLSTAKMENDFKDIKARFPGMPEAELNVEYGTEVVKGVTKYYTDAITSFKNTATEWNTKNGVLIEVDKDGKPLHPEKVISPAMQAQIKYNNSMANQFKKMAEETTAEFTKKLGYDPITGTVDPNSESYKKAVTDISSNPRDYISQVYMNHAADTWATGVGNISSVEMKANPIAEAINKQENERWEREFKEQQFNITAGLKDRALDLKTIVDYKRAGIPIPQSILDEAGIIGFDNSGNAITTGVGGTGTGAGKRPVAPSFGSGNVTVTGIDINKLPNPINAFHQNQQGIINNINTTALSDDGFLNVLSMVPDGMGKADIALLSNDLQNAIRTGKYTSDPAAQKRFNDMNKILENNGITNTLPVNGKYVGPNQYRQALMELTNKQSQVIYQAADSDKAATGLRLAQQYHEMQDQLATYTKKQEEYTTSVRSFIASDKTGVYKKIYDRDRGVLYTTEDIANDMPRSITALDENGKEYTLSGRQLAGRWEQGLGLGTIPRITTVDGSPVKHEFAASTPAGGPGMKSAVHTLYYNKSTGTWNALDQVNKYVDSKYGTPKEREELMKKASTSVLSKMNEYNTGISGASIDYDLSDKENPVQRVTGEKLIGELLIPTNEGIYPMYTTGDDNKMSGVLSNELQSAMHNAKYRDGYEGLISGVRVTQFGPNGTPAAEITFSQDKPKDESKERSALRDTKSIWIDISPDAKGALLNQLPKAQTVFKYGNLLYGTDAVTSSPTEESMGFKYSIIPGQKDTQGRSTSAKIVSSHWSINPDGTIRRKPDGTPEWTEEVDTRFNLMEGEHALSPDELMQKKNDWQMSILRKRQQLLKISEGSNSANGQPGWVTIGSLYNK